MSDIRVPGQPERSVSPVQHGEVRGRHGPGRWSVWPVWGCLVRSHQDLLNSPGKIFLAAFSQFVICSRNCLFVAGRIWETDLAEEADYHENVTSGLYLVVIVQYIRCCSAPVFSKQSQTERIKYDDQGHL